MDCNVIATQPGGVGGSSPVARSGERGGGREREVGLGGWLVLVADGGWLWLVDVLWPATGVGVGGGCFLTCGED